MGNETGWLLISFMTHCQSFIAHHSLLTTCALMPKNSWIDLHTTLPGPIARGILELDHKYVSPSYSRPYPLVAKKGEGMESLSVQLGTATLGS